MNRLILAQLLPGKDNVEQCPWETALPGGLYYGHVPVVNITVRDQTGQGKIIASYLTLIWTSSHKQTKFTSFGRSEVIL